MGKPLGNRTAWRHQLDACTRAADLLKAAGFELRYISMKAESCYYGWPGKPWTIRVAGHRHNGPRGSGPTDTVIAKITISAAMTHYQGGINAVPDSRLVALVATAIGVYFLRCGGLKFNRHGYDSALDFEPPMGMSMPKQRAAVAQQAEAPA